MSLEEMQLFEGELKSGECLEARGFKEYEKWKIPWHRRFYCRIS